MPWASTSTLNSKFMSLEKRSILLFGRLTPSPYLYISEKMCIKDLLKVPLYLDWLISVLTVCLISAYI